MCIAMGKTLDDPNRLKMTTHELYFKTPEEMAKLFDYAPDAIKNTLVIAEKCNLEFKKKGFVLPKFDIPAEFTTQEEYLKHLCVIGLLLSILINICINGNPFSPRDKTYQCRRFI